VIIVQFGKDIERQINEEFTQYIFYRRDSSSPTAGYHCHCTRCNRSYYADYSEICVDGYTLRHGNYAKCPACKHTGVLHHENRGKKCLTERRAFVIWHKESENKVTAYAVYAAKAYEGDPWESWLNKNYTSGEYDPSPQIELYEKAIYHFTPGDVRVEKSSYYDGWHETRTKITEPFSAGPYGSEPIYTFINESVLQSSFLRYSAYKLYLDKIEKRAGIFGYYGYSQCPKLMKYICAYALYPQLEMMLKAGMEQYVCEAVEFGAWDKRYFNWNAAKPCEFFKRLTPQQAKEMLEYDIAPQKAVEYCKLTRAGVKISVKQFRNIYHDISYPDKLFGLLKKPYGITVTKAFNYLSRFKGILSKNLTTWADYIHDAEELGFDLSVHNVLYPKNLIEAHAATINVLNAKRIEKETKEMAALTKRLKKQYRFEFGDLAIKIPESIQEIITEGKVLHHCVGGYADRHAKGQCIIVFLRKKAEPNTPYYTIEIGGKWGSRQHIVQCHGYANEAYNKKPQEIRDFEKEFSKFLMDPKGYKKQKQREKLGKKQEPMPVAV
jgi:hypothetical protein